MFKMENSLQIYKGLTKICLRVLHTYRRLLHQRILKNLAIVYFLSSVAKIK